MSGRQLASTQYVHIIDCQNLTKNADKQVVPRNHDIININHDKYAVQVHMYNFNFYVDQSWSSGNGKLNDFVFFDQSSAYIKHENYGFKYMINTPLKE